MGSTNAVQQALLAGLSKLKTSADYFDLTITCGGKEFKVHRAVVCSQSDFFDAACKGSFKEAMTGKIELKVVDPKLVEQLIEYLYTLDYDDGLGVNGRDPIGDKTPAFHLECHASKLAIDMHATADKYGVQGLKELATYKLEKIMAAIDWGSWKADDFVAIAGQVYEKTRSVDRMREIVQTRAVQDLGKLVERASFHDLLAKEPQFAVDLLTAYSKVVKVSKCRTDSCRYGRRSRMIVDSCWECGDNAYTLGTSWKGEALGLAGIGWSTPQEHAGRWGADWSQTRQHGQP